MYCHFELGVLLWVKTLTKITKNTIVHTSFPNGNVLPKEEHSPTTLATKVLNVRYSFSTTPRKIVFISGMPEPCQWIQRKLIFITFLFTSSELNIITAVNQF